MIAKLLSPIGRRETLLAATIVIVPTIIVLSVITQPLRRSGYGALALLLVCYYLSALFVGDRIVKIVLRNGNKLFWSALAWAIISHILGVIVTSLFVTFFGISPTDNFLELLGLTVWYVGLIAGIVALLPMIVGIVYYWKQLGKIKDKAMADTTQVLQG